jgi:hypothetical protein
MACLSRKVIWRSFEQGADVRWSSRFEWPDTFRVRMRSSYWGPMVRWVGDSPELGPAVPSCADAASPENEHALREALRRCGELFFTLTTTTGSA